MNTLEMYKKLSNEDKTNLTTYSIYESIYNMAKNFNYDITDDEVEKIKALSNYIYLKDEYYNLSPTKISDFIMECYLKHKISLDKLETVSWNNLIEAIDNNNYKFCISEENER